MIFDYAKLKGRIVEKFGTFYQFAKAINSSPQSVSNKLKNSVSISQKDIILWSEILDISPGEIGKYFFTLKV